MKDSTFKIICFILLCSFIICSCKETPRSVKLLIQAQKIADGNPSEALVLLDSISNPEAMEQDYYMQYIVTCVQAKYKNNQNVSGDTLIFEAKKYFETKKDSHNSALANFYTGCVYYQNNKVDKALINYMEAEHYAHLSKNAVLQARSQNNIGYLYYEQNVMDSAIFHYRLALDYYDKVKDVDVLKMQTIYSMGSAFYKNYDLDSSSFFYNKGLHIANEVGNQKYQGIFTNHLGMVDRVRGDYDGASAKLHWSLAQKTISSVDSLRIYLNLINLYSNTEQLDSAHFYADLLKNRLSEITDKRTLRSTYSSLSEYNKQVGNYTDALRYADLESKMRENIKEENHLLDLLEADKKYALEQKAKKKK